MSEVFQSFFAYYGLDWMTMILGLWGGYLLTQKNSAGFAFNFIASFCAFAVALMSGQYGFIVYNFIFMGIALKGYRGWSKPIIEVS